MPFGRQWDMMPGLRQRDSDLDIVFRFDWLTIKTRYEVTSQHPSVNKWFGPAEIIEFFKPMHQMSAALAGHQMFCCISRLLTDY